jgi:hypothetical protein
MGTVEEYSNRFQALLPRAGRLDESQHVQLFTGGLLPPLSHAVRIHHPETLATAMSLARQVELMERDRPAPPPPRAPHVGCYLRHGSRYPCPRCSWRCLPHQRPPHRVAMRQTPGA